MRFSSGRTRIDRVVVGTLIAAVPLGACGLDAGGQYILGPEDAGVDVVPGIDSGPDVVVADAFNPDEGPPPAVDSGDAPSVVLDASGCDASTSDDPRNCGACGHDCGGETCAGGLCQPETLVTGLGSPEFVRLAGSTLYASTGGDHRVISCATSGCGSTPTTVLLANSADDLLGLAIDSAGYYTTEQATGDMLTCTFAGCANVVRDVSNAARGDGITLDGSGHVFWVDETDQSQAANTGEILVAGTDGSNPQVFLGGLNQPIDVLFAGGKLYWSDQADGKIEACDPTNCGPTRVTIVQGQANPAYLAVDGAHVYWTNAASAGGSSDGSVVQANLGGGSVITLASNLPYPRGIVVDGADIFFTNYVSAASNAGTIMTCAVNGCGGNPTTIAKGQGAPLGITTDATYVYWAAETDGAIRRVAK